jgi:mannose-6-phosphate isomerase-like protein (cupin superfamily)
MKAMKLHEVEGVRVPDPYKRTIKILVTPEKDMKPLGLSVPIRVTNAIESRKGTVGVSLIEPGKGMEPHIHKDEDETIFIISGRGEYTFNDTVVEFEPDMVIHVPAGEEHGLRNTGDEMIKQIWFMVPV